MRMLGKNVRSSYQALGDLQSFVTATTPSVPDACCPSCRTTAWKTWGALADVVQGLSERAMREAIRALPHGDYTSTITNNPLGTPMTYPVRLRIAGDTVEVDFEGAPPQLARGGINCTLNYTAAHATYPLKCMLTPTVRGTRAVTAHHGEGT